MKNTSAIILILCLYCMTTAFQCNTCSTDALLLNNTRSWFPLKGKTQLSFLDNSENVINFSLFVKDTIETLSNECGDMFKVESLVSTLYLNSEKTDSIHFSLASAGWLCMHAVSNNESNIGMCNVFGLSKESVVAKKLFDQLIGTRIYQEVILLLPNEGNDKNIDSLFIANNFGIVGFNYSNNKYTLQ